jgi:hypothetical protein
VLDAFPRGLVMLVSQVELIVGEQISILVPAVGS